MAKQGQQQRIRPVLRREQAQADPMVAEGAIVYGTPLHRLQESLQVEPVMPLAGDVADVCRLCNPKDEIVADLSQRSSGYRGVPIPVKQDEVRYLIDSLTSNKTAA